LSSYGGLFILAINFYQDFTLSPAVVLTALGACDEDVLTDEQATCFHDELYALLAKYSFQSSSQNNDPKLKHIAHYHLGDY
jgi:hypothetical protein